MVDDVSFVAKRETKFKKLIHVSNANKTSTSSARTENNGYMPGFVRMQMMNTKVCESLGAVD